MATNSESLTAFMEKLSKIEKVLLIDIQGAGCPGGEVSGLATRECRKYKAKIQRAYGELCEADQKIADTRKTAVQLCKLLP